MKYLKEIIRLADKFAQQIEQNGTTELFFDSADKQKLFSEIIQNPDGKAANILKKYYETSGQPTSFSLKINATPNVGAEWILRVSPASLTKQVEAIIDAEFQSFMKQNRAARLSQAQAKAKAGSGAGLLNVGSLDLE